MYQFCSKLSFITHRNQWFLTVAKILLKKKIDRNNLWCMHGTKLRIIDNSELVYFLGETLLKKKYSSSTKMDLPFLSIQ